MACGFCAIAVAFGGFVYCTSTQWKARRFKRDHPVISVIVILLAGYLLVYMFGAVIVFMFGIAFPLLCKYHSELFHMGPIKQKLVFGHIQTVKTQIRLHACSI